MNEFSDRTGQGLRLNIRPPESIPVRGTDGPFALSFAQERLWFLDRMEGGLDAYNVWSAIRIRGPIDVDALERNWRATVDRHEALRTTFVEVRGEPLAVLRDDLDPPFLRELAADEDAARARATAIATAPYSLAEGPLARAALIAIAPDDHVLLLAMSHLVSDGWTRTILLREMVEGLGGKPPLRIGYGDFAAWQRSRTHGPAEAFWGTYLAGSPPALEIPPDRPRPSVPENRGGVVRKTIPGSLAASIGEFARSAGATPFMVTLAAWKAVLARIAATNDVLVGTPVAGRPRSELEDLAGMFVNTVVLRTRVSATASFTELVSAVRENSLEAFEHQDYPFERLLPQLGVERDLSRTPVFQVMFAYRNHPFDPPRLPDASVERMTLRRTGTPFDLALDLSPVEDGIAAELRYRADLFTDHTAGSILRRYARFMSRAIETPDRPIGRLPIGAERDPSCYVRRGVQAPVPEGGIHSEFERRATERPEAPAVVGALTYGDLDALANGVAHHLLAKGAGRGRRVAVAMERSPEAIVALLGVLKTGAAWVPVPDARRESIFATAEPVAVLEGIAGIDPTADRPGVKIEPNDPAYVIFTSGSTGEPKGVIGTHIGAANRIGWMGRAFPFRTEETGVSKTAMAFIGFLWEVFDPLSAGARVAIVPDERVTNVERFVDALAANDVRRLMAVPSLLAAMLDRFPDLSTRLPDLRLLFSVGEALPAALAGRVLAELPDRRLLNLYGSTEDSGDVTFAEIEGAKAPIGRPIDNVSAVVVDERLRPVPDGIPGELAVGGTAPGSGYLEMEELTAERFVTSPFDGERRFLTGDRARALPDGSFEYLGRRDDQLKIRGFRIEPGEIAAVLLDRADVGAAHAGRHDGRLVSWVEPAGDDVPAVADLRDHVASRLPDYMVPARFVVTEELPRTATGKVDRRALPPPPETTGGGGRLAEGTETLLARLWQQVLGVRGVGPDDDFFALGGHSLLAVRLFAEIEKRFGVTLPLATLFRAPTLAALASALVESQEETPWAPLVPIRPGGDEPPFFCVHGLGGNVVSLRDLARRIDPGRPFIGLQSPALRRDRRPPLTIDALARIYVEEIRRARPKGPYLLGGLCFGSLVAFEMARKLRADGEDVPALALIDPPAVPAAGPKTGRGYRRLLFRIAILQLRRTLLRRTVTYPTVKHVNRIIRSRYDPRPYDGPVTLFLSTEYGRESRRDATREPAWRKVSTGSFDVQVIPGHHRFLLHEPRVGRLAERLTETLRSATL